MHDPFETYRNISYRYLSIRNRSEKEMKDYLLKRNASPEIIDQVITLLKEQKFLNDVAFARSWIRSRALLKPKGRSVLKMELKQKGVAAEIIETVLTESSEDTPDELTQAKQLIAKRMGKFSGRPRQEIYNKVGSFLARRGFSWEIAKKAIDESL